MDTLSTGSLRIQPSCAESLVEDIPRLAQHLLGQISLLRPADIRLEVIRIDGAGEGDGINSAAASRDRKL